MTEHLDEDLRGIDWFEHDLSGRQFVRCDLSRAVLEEVTASGCVFEECDLTEVRFNGSTWTDSAFLRCRLRGVSFSGATLRGCKLTGSRFEETCVLRPMTVEGGDWTYVSLRYQDVHKLDLTGVRLRDADLTGADLHEAVLRDADLGNATFHDTRLYGADLRGARLLGVDLRTVELDHVKLDLSQAVQLAMTHGADVDWTP